MCRVVIKNLDVLVVSYGGVGTTFMIDYISRYKSVNDSKNSDGLKHTPWQPVALNRKMKVLYIFGDPVDATKSLFRRGYHAVQANNLSTSLFPYRKIRSDWSIGEYASRGVDGLGLKQHFLNWEANVFGYQTLFVSYDSLWDCSEEIVRFLGLPENSLDEFPEKLTRNSVIKASNSDVDNKLNEIYRDLIEIQGKHGGYSTSESVESNSQFIIAVLCSIWRIPVVTLVWYGRTLKRRLFLAVQGK